MRSLNTFLFAALAAFCVPALADEAEPSATIMIDQTQVELILGGDLGKGHLTVDGQNYTFKTGGLKLGGIGIHTEHLIGHVYHMTGTEHFEGTYFNAEAGVTLVKGKGGMWLKNDKGVTIHLRSADDSGVALSIGVEGLKIHELKPEA